MNDYFKPRRRKLGVLTLMMTLLFLVGWGRSVITFDTLWIARAFGYSHTFESSHGKCKWDIFPATTGDGTQWVVSTLPEASTANFEGWPLTWYETELLSTAFPAQSFCGLSITIYYWIVVAPLTLLSAWLLLSKRLLTSPKVPA